MSDDAALQAANAAYYRAFASDDFSTMSRLWADDAISCVHPGWAPLLGREAVLESYRAIMKNPDRHRVEHGSGRAIVAGGEGRVLCIEFVDGIALAATNCFRRIDGAWRMVHHQASLIAGPVETDNPPVSSKRFN